MSAKLNEIDQRLKENIAKRIIELRKSSGKNQSEFAIENLESEKQVLHRIESGRGATIYTINKICLSLNITLTEFFDSPLFNS